MLLLTLLVYRRTIIYLEASHLTILAFSFQVIS